MFCVIFIGFSNVLGSLCVSFIGFSNVLGSVCVIFIGFPMFWAPYVSFLLVFPMFWVPGVCFLLCFCQCLRVLEAENLGKTNENHKKHNFSNYLPMVVSRVEIV